MSTMLKIDGVSKQYKLGQIGGTTLRDELRRKRAKLFGKDDPTAKIGANMSHNGELFKALDGLSFEVEQGERVGIIGHNGAGKSTLLKLISRVTAPTEGTICMNGRVASMLEVGTGFHGELTGRENIYLNGAILGMTKKEIDSKIEDIITFSECRQFIDTPVKRYSSGMYVKLAFAVASHLDSEILIMDEVLAVGDVAFQKKCLNKMSDVSMTDGRTILYVSHNMSTIRRLCTRCIVLDHGKMVFDGDVDSAIEVYSQTNGSEMILTYPLTDAKRPFREFGKRAALTGFSFLDKDCAVFANDEPIAFSVDFSCRERIEGLKLYVRVQTTDEITIGIAQMMEVLCDGDADTDYTFKFRWDPSMLGPGKYKMQLDLYSDDGNGNHKSLDHPLQDIYFEIAEKTANGMVWIPYFGKVRLRDLEVIR